MRFIPRFSLKTALVLVFAGGLLLWLNIRPRAVVDERTPNDLYHVYYFEVYGWPMSFRNVQVGGLSASENLDWSAVNIDILMGLSILVIVACVSEFIVRWHNRRSESHNQ